VAFAPSSSPLRSPTWFVALCTRFRGSDHRHGSVRLRCPRSLRPCSPPTCRLTVNAASRSRPLALHPPPLLRSGHMQSVMVVSSPCSRYVVRGGATPVSPLLRQGVLARLRHNPFILYSTDWSTSSFRPANTVSARAKYRSKDVSYDLPLRAQYSHLPTYSDAFLVFLKSDRLPHVLVLTIYLAPIF